MTFEEELNELLATQIDSWVFHGTTANPDADATVFFAHTPSEDRPNGLPLPYSDLETLNDEYGVLGVSSVSSGETGSRLTVTLERI